MRFVATVVIQPDGPALLKTKDGAKEIGNSLDELRRKAKEVGSGAAEMAGIFGSKAKELAEGLSGAISKASSLAGEIGKLGGLAPMVASLAVAIGLLGVGLGIGEFLKDVVQEGMKTQVIVEQLNNTLRSTGSAAGYSAKELIEHAEALVRVTGRSKEEIIGVEGVLVRYTKLGHEALPVAIQASLDYSQATGKSAKEAAGVLGPALEGNAKSMTRLKDIGLVFTAGQKLQLAEMVKTGDIAGYQALIFAALKEKVGGAAEAYASTLAGGVAIAHAEFGLFKETIASEVIPALQDLFNDTIKSLGGWDAIHEAMQRFAKDVGTHLADAIYGLRIKFHEINLDLMAIELQMRDTFGDKAVSMFKNLAGTKPLASMMAWVATGTNPTEEVMSEDPNKGNALIAKMLAENQAIADITRELANRKPALEGDDKLWANHGSILDSVAGKEKKAKDGIDAAKKAYDSLVAAIAAAELKMSDEISDRNRLISATLQGEAVYKREAAAIALAKQERAEEAALLKTYTSAYDAATRAIEESTKAYGANSEQAKEALELQIQSTVAYAVALKQADLDYIANTTGAIALAGLTERRDRDRASIEAWAERQTQARKELIALGEESAKITAETVDWQAQAAAVDLYGESIAGILKGYGLLSPGTDALAAKQRALALAFEATGKAWSDLSPEDKAKFLTDATDEQKTLENQKVYLAGLEIAKKDTEALKNIWKQVGSTMNGDVIDALAKIATGTRVSLTDILQSWLEMWAKAMLQWLEMWAANMLKAKVLTEAGTASSSGGVSGSVAANAATGGDGALGSLFSGGGGGASAGTIASWLVVAYAAWIVYKVFWDNTKTYAGQATIAAGGAAVALSGANSYAQQAGSALLSVMAAAQDLAQHLNLGLLSLIEGSVTISINSNKEIVVSTLIDPVGKVFTDIAAAMDYAKVQALKFAAYATTTAQLVKDAIAASKATTTAGLEADIQLGQTLATQNLAPAGGSIAAAFQVFNEQTAHAAALFGYAVNPYGKNLDALNRAFDSSVTKLAATVAAIKNQLLGVDTSTSDYLASLGSFNQGLQDQADAARKKIQEMIDQEQAQINAILSRAPSPGGPGGPGAGEGNPSDGVGRAFLNVIDITPEMQARLDELQRQVAQYTDQLDKIPQELSDAEINMGIFNALDKYVKDSGKYREEEIKWARARVDIEFALIKLKLIELNKWEEFSAMFTDAYNQALAAAGKPTAGHAGAGGTRAADHQTALDNLEGLRAAAGGPAAQTLLQFAQNIRSFDEAAKKGKLSAAQIAEGERLLAEQRDRTLHEQVAAGIQSLGLPLESTWEGIQKLADTLRQLYDAVGAGTMSLAQFNSVWDQQVIQSQQTLMGLAESIATASGDAAKAAEIKAKTDQVNFEIQVMQFNILLTSYEALGLISGKAMDDLEGLRTWINAQHPDFTPKPVDTTAAPALTAAAESLASTSNTFQDAVNAFKSATDSLVSSFRSIYGSTTLGGSAQDVLAFQKGQFQAVEGAALGGDVTARGQFGQQAEAYLAALNTANAGGALFAAERERLYHEFETLFAQTTFTSGGVGFGPGTGIQPTPIPNVFVPQGNAPASQGSGGTLDSSAIVSAIGAFQQAVQGPIVATANNTRTNSADDAALLAAIARLAELVRQRAA